MAAQKTSALTQESVPALDDFIPVVSAALSNYKQTLNRLGGFLLNSVCNARLTTQSGVPVTTADRTAQTTLYLTPYQGNKVALWDGTRWNLYILSEISISVVGLTAPRSYDVFLYDNGGTLTLELSAAWTSDTVQADAIAQQDGVDVKSANHTRRWVGTIRLLSGATIDDSLLRRFVWNHDFCNRVPRDMSVVDPASSWTYTSGTVRQANANSANKLEYVCGLADVPVRARITAAIFSGADTSFQYAVAGIGVDTSASFSGQQTPTYFPNPEFAGPCTASYSGVPGVGFHGLYWNERGATGTSTFFGTQGAVISGMNASVMA